MALEPKAVKTLKEYSPLDIQRWELTYDSHGKNADPHGVTLEVTFDYEGDDFTHVAYSFEDGPWELTETRNGSFTVRQEYHSIVDAFSVTEFHTEALSKFVEHKL